MSEMFNVMYDEIFLKDNHTNTLDNERINAITKRYIESKANVEDKKNFLKLKREYLKIINIKDYKALQNQLYGNKNRNEIISFELARILSKSNKDVDVFEQVSSVEKILSLHDDDIPDDLYVKIINGILRLEISLGMRIGLFNEFCCLFEDEIKKIDANLMTDDISYTMKK